MAKKLLSSIRLRPVGTTALFCLFGFLLTATVAFSQSSDQAFPTPVRTNEIIGAIKARDVGDARLTSHFYTFDGSQGDVFVNVQTTNFYGDIDIYVMPGLRPLSKIVIYPDQPVAETGRVIYLRKSETLLLRIEGRTPGDEEASYRIKFAGSFVASKAADIDRPELPKAKSDSDRNIRVNSVGTIIEVIPKPTPTPKETAIAKDESKPEPDEKAEPETIKPVAEEKAVPTEEKTEEGPPRKTEVVVTDPLADKPTETVRTAPTKAPPTRRRRTVPPKPGVEAKAEPPRETEPPKRTATTTKRPSRAVKPPATEEKPVDPMASVRLVIRFKDGSIIERPMTEVFKFTVEKAVLTVISRDGTIGRYKMIDVAGVTIE